jgi:signal transduction histidine kinase
MEIIFNNLISNAIKYNREGGSVDCTVRENEHYIEILVEDTGIGINQEDLNKIFDDFVRIKNEKTRNITGTGLGLAIVKKLVDNYQGKIEVTSQPDQGSKFSVRLPIDKPCL